MGDKVINLDEARYQRHRRQLQRQIALAGQQAAAAFLAHLEAVARGAPQEVVNKRWQAVEERAVAYQELLQAGETALQSGLDNDLREQIDGEFEAEWLETLREACLEVLAEEASGGPGEADGAARVHRACQVAYRHGYAAGMR